MSALARRASSRPPGLTEEEKDIVRSECRDWMMQRWSRMKPEHIRLLGLGDVEIIEALFKMWELHWWRARALGEDPDV